MISKLTIQNCDTQEDLVCLFNPTEYSMSKSISWTPKKQTGANVGPIEYTGSSPRSLSMELFFDVLEKPDGDLRPILQKLWAMAMVDDTQKNAATSLSRPPLCRFTWGTEWSFVAAITSLSVRYTLFSADGTPVRATASVQFQEAEDETQQEGQNPTSHSEPGLRLREVRPHDSLPLIAYEEYGDPTQWRRIALANSIDDPLGLAAGQVLTIPRA